MSYEYVVNISSLCKKLADLEPNTSTVSRSFYAALDSLDVATPFYNASKKDCVELAMHKSALQIISTVLSEKAAVASDRAGWSHYYFGNILERLCRQLTHRINDKADKIIRESENDFYKAFLFRKGMYSSIKTIDHLALNAEGKELLDEVVAVCSISALRKLNKRKKLPKSVKSVIYQRLGPVECLDDMINDKYANNRELGYRYAPYGYPLLEEKVLTEIARGPTMYLIEKLKAEVLPMLLANRNVLKNTWVAKKIEERLNAGE